ncbi:MAG: cytochrome P450 [Deltaproteobacteria bacterium]|nr:MAG: cytochrome P450 [Deltaproteobacteria bacterium]
MPLDIPGPRGLPLVGSLAAFARDPLAFCMSLREEYGDLAYFRVGGHDVVLVNDADLVGHVLKQKPEAMHKDAIYELMRPLLGNGLVTAEDETWRRHRALAAPSFAKRHVDSYAATMAECGTAYLAELEDGETRDLHDDMMDMTQEIALRTLFGGDLGLDVSGVGPAIATAMEAFTYNAHGPGRLIPDFIPTRTRRRAAEGIAALDALIYKAIEGRRALGLGDDLLSRLIAATDDEGRGFDDVQLRDEAVTLFLAGHETTALALTHALLLLHVNPEALTWVLEEVDADAGPLDATALRRLPRVEAAVKEAMRLQPPAWVVGREAMTDLELGGYHVPRGTQLLVSQWVIHRDERYFPEPLVYRPQRWVDGSTEALPKLAYLPFGAGPRICIGNHFAMLEAVIGMAAILREVTLEPLGPVPPKSVPSITLRPVEPSPVRVRRRT